MYHGMCHLTHPSLLVMCLRFLSLLLPLVTLSALPALTLCHALSAPLFGFAVGTGGLASLGSDTYVRALLVVTILVFLSHLLCNLMILCLTFAEF